MARIKIFRKNGTPTPYFWSSRNSGDRTSVRVYKKTVDGIKRMRGVRFNAVTKRMLKA